MKRKFQNIGVSPLTGKTVIIFSQSFFHRLFECPKNNLGPLTRRQLHPPDVNHFAFTYSTRGSVGASKWGWVPKTGRTHQWNSNRVPSGFKTDELSHCVTFQNYFREPRQNLLYFNLHKLICGLAVSVTDFSIIAESITKFKFGLKRAFLPNHLDLY